MKACFLHDPADLDSPIPGGVQLCSREFLAIVRAAADETRLIPVSISRAPIRRLRRKLGLGSYLLYRPEEARAALAAALHELRPTHFFINRAELARFAPFIRTLDPGARVVLMSHGNQSGDDLYELAGPLARPRSAAAAWLASTRLGLDLRTESRLRHWDLHGVCVMSDEEAVIERWLGATRIAVLPRCIGLAPLEWRPIAARVGFVGTLDHTPNRAALELICSAIANWPERPELRIVGGPEEAGWKLAQRYSFVTFAGRLPDSELRAEAATWSWFLNPIFWLSRGASMKLGQALGWGLPTISTRSGARGYRIGASEVRITSDDPHAFADEVRRALSDPSAGPALREAIFSGASHWPTTESLGRELRATFV